MPISKIPRSVFAALFLIVVPACGRPSSSQQFAFSSSGMTIGYGFMPNTDPRVGVQQVVSLVALENLVHATLDGRVRPALFERWTTSQDGLVWRFKLASGLRFHTGLAVDGSVVEAFLSKNLAGYLGPAFEDIDRISVTARDEIAFYLKRRSAFLLEGLNIPLADPTSKSLAGTGPFLLSGPIGEQTEMRANPAYHGGRPSLDRLSIRTYSSSRSAWADLLRGQVDMLYEVGIDALDSLQPSSVVQVFTYDRPFAAMILFNTRRPRLRDPLFRRGLNAAIDRSALVADVFHGHATPADSPVSPHHWAYDSQLPRFRYEPRALTRGSERIRLSCIFGDPSLERLGLAVQKQLAAVGVDLELERLALDDYVARRTAGDFEALLGDFVSGPTLFRPYSFWHSDGVFNLGRFSSAAVDAALDSVRHAADDAEYKAGVAAYARAIVDDPPAIFLTWNQRIRAVSRRFIVPVDPGHDIFPASLRLMRPSTKGQLASRN